MSNAANKLIGRNLRKQRVRQSVSGSTERPRLSIFISNLHGHAQVIDDTTGKTLASSTSVTSNTKGNLSAKAAWVGDDIAKKAKKAKISKVVLDRNGRKYHGRLKASADAARAGGLEF